MAPSRPFRLPRPPAATAAPAALAAIALAVAVLPVRAEPPVTAEEFERATTGLTVHWTAQGRLYGSEQYLPGRQVLWAVEGGECLRGHWWAEGSRICFSYEDAPAPVCWTISREGGRLAARPVDDPDGLPLIAASESDRPLACRGPRVGV
ncbi:MAG: hypothetical protein N2422_07900 [Rhodobacteraceae bacterium]|nr:hypothetical protein [Paracoccaceae bacterium]